MNDHSRAIACNAKRIVVKIGSSVLTENGALRGDFFDSIAEQVAALLEEGREILLVSSGAVAAGSHVLGWNHTGRSIREKQAAAAVGQIGLVEKYRKRFSRFGRPVAQVLVTRSGLENRKRFLNARHTLLELLQQGVVPIINENDTIATEEIQFGDNDNLSATVVNLVNADLLILLTDVEGLYESKPVANAPAPPLIHEVETIDQKIREAASGAGSAIGRGGMITKLEAATTAAHSGAATIICNGMTPGILRRVTQGEVIGTLIHGGEKISSRKHWLAFTARIQGEIVVDAGAAQALELRGHSLLPAGIIALRNSFDVGDLVSVVTQEGREIARGLVAYSRDEIQKILGRKTDEITSILGYSNGNEVIHRDDLLVIPTQGGNTNES